MNFYSLPKEINYLIFQYLTIDDMQNVKLVNKPTYSYFTNNFLTSMNSKLRKRFDNIKLLKSKDFRNLSYKFLRSYILINFKKYEPCDDRWITDQIKYLNKMITCPNTYRFKHFLNKSRYRIVSYTKSGLREIKYPIEKQMLKDTLYLMGPVNDNPKIGDIIYRYQSDDITYDDYIYCREHKMKKFYRSEKLYRIPKQIRLIEDFPLNYYFEFSDVYIFYFNLNPYLEEVKANLVKKESQKCIKYNSHFKHNWGKTYKICYRIPIKGFYVGVDLTPSSKYYKLDYIKDILSAGYFLADINKKDCLIIDKAVIQVLLKKWLI